jgi:hypothetical protein
MITGRWSEVSAEHEVRYAGKVKFWVIEGIGRAS